MTDQPKMINRTEAFTNLTVNDLVDWCVQRGLDPDQVRATGGHLRWESPQTAREKELYDAWGRRHEQRTEEWERMTYERLRAKFSEK